MKIVIDANRIIAALIKQSTTRDILFDGAFEFVTPDFALSEIEEHISDVPYIAACISSKSLGIWSHDPHILKQKKISVFTNINMLNLSKSAKQNQSPKIEQRSGLKTKVYLRLAQILSKDI